MKSNNSKDAIGNDIELGHVYGFTVDNVGMCYVTIGEALNFTNSGLVTLRRIRFMNSVYDNWLVMGRLLLKLRGISLLKLYP